MYVFYIHKFIFKSEKQKRETLFEQYIEQPVNQQPILNQRDCLPHIYIRLRHLYPHFPTPNSYPPRHEHDLQRVTYDKIEIKTMRKKKASE